MGYGPDKITAPDALKNILEVLHDKLATHGIFSNNSLGFYAIEMEYTLTLRFHARQESKEVMAGYTTIGDIRASGGSDDKPVETVRAQGQAVAGSVPETSGRLRGRPKGEDKSKLAGKSGAPGTTPSDQNDSGSKTGSGDETREPVPAADSSRTGSAGQS